MSSTAQLTNLAQAFDTLFEVCKCLAFAAAVPSIYFIGKLATQL